MARPIGPRKVYRYSDHFRATAVRLSELPGVCVQDVAQSLDVHPFVLSRWRRDAWEGRLVTERVKLDDRTQAELKELRQIKRDYLRLKEEHDLLKKPSGSFPNEGRNLRVHPRPGGSEPDRSDVSLVWGYPGRVLRLARSAAVRSART